MSAENIATFQMGTHPALTASPIAYQLVNAAENALSKIKRPRILMVEDDPDFVEATMAILSSQPYSVDAAYNRKEAMEKIEADKPDLILLDIMLENVDDGFKVCQEIKSDPEYWNIPVIAMSAIAEKAGVSPGLGEHFKADYFIEKPIKAPELLGKIKEFLNR
jgi:CheY-like chemotaxis protein